MTWLLRMNLKRINKLRQISVNGFKFVSTAWTVLCVCRVLASPVQFNPDRLGSSIFDDTEVSTNLPFNSGAASVREFMLQIGLNANTTNTVQVAFGVDSDENGLLEWHETEFLLGWRCGGWFYRDKIADAANYAMMTGGVRTLEWILTLDSNRKAKRLEARDGSATLSFTATCGMFNPEWNLARITVRGGETLETISGELLRPGLTVKVR